MCVRWQATYLQETRAQTVAPVPAVEAGAQLLPGIEAYLTQHDIYQKLDALVEGGMSLTDDAGTPALSAAVMDAARALTRRT